MNANHGTFSSLLRARLQPSSDKKAAVFATSGGPNPKVISVLQKILEEKEYEVVSIFKCRGQFLLTNRGRLNEEDLKNAKAFAHDLASKHLQ